jgi:hypothetical protein
VRQLPDLLPETGTLSGHVFENPRAGVVRGLYWSFRGHFAAVEIDGSEWSSSVLLDWLTFDVRGWPDLDGVDATALRLPDLAEASVYFMDFHQTVELVTFRLDRVGGARFDATVELSGELELLDGTRMPRSPIVWRGPVELTGVVIVPENLFPKPLTAQEATAVLAAFIDPSGFSAPERDATQWAFSPLESGQANAPA